jgi:hypothetical protein
LEKHPPADTMVMPPTAELVYHPIAEMVYIIDFSSVSCRTGDGLTLLLGCGGTREALCQFTSSIAHVALARAPTDNSGRDRLLRSS